MQGQENENMIAAFLESAPPYNNLTPEVRQRLARAMSSRCYDTGELIYQVDDALGGVFIIMEGEVETLDRYGALVSLLTARNTFGELGFLRVGLAASTADATQPSKIQF